MTIRLNSFYLVPQEFDIIRNSLDVFFYNRTISKELISLLLEGFKEEDKITPEYTSLFRLHEEIDTIANNPSGKGVLENRLFRCTYRMVIDEKSLPTMDLKFTSMEQLTGVECSYAIILVRKELLSMSRINTNSTGSAKIIEFKPKSK